jgi:hypothetical protein
VVLLSESVPEVRLSTKSHEGEMVFLRSPSCDFVDVLVRGKDGPD